MANRVNRYKTVYERMVRPNNGSTFPRHVFVRAANLHASLYDRVGDRENCFETTLIHLTERFNGKEVYLVGTMNQSTMLAQRTKKLIEEIKPDAVLVQTNEQWWSKAKLLQYVDSQEELSRYNQYLEKGSQHWLEYYWSVRKFVFLTRYALYWSTFKLHFRFGFDFKFWLPGIEVKYACEAAEKVGAQIQFLGNELNSQTADRLYHETRMNIPQYLMKRIMYTQSFYTEELGSNRQKIAQSNPQTFTEKCLDQHLINWYIQSSSIFFPRLKEIFVDKRDEDLFKLIDQSEAQKIVVLVNQWHIEGIEHHWCHRYGQLPRSVNFTEPINPIGDMNLREGLFQRLYNSLHREISSSYTKGAPSTYADWIIGYHRESNWQYEHRDM